MLPGTIDPADRSRMSLLKLFYHRHVTDNYGWMTTVYCVKDTSPVSPCEDENNNIPAMKLIIGEGEQNREENAREIKISTSTPSEEVTLSIIKPVQPEDVCKTSMCVKPKAENGEAQGAYYVHYKLHPGKVSKYECYSLYCLMLLDTNFESLENHNYDVIHLKKGIGLISGF